LALTLPAGWHFIGNRLQMPAKNMLEFLLPKIFFIELREGKTSTTYYGFFH